MAEKVYVVTGASSGIGVAIVESLVKSGVKKVVLVAQRKDRLEQVAESCKKLGATDVLVLSKDLLNLDSCPEVVNETVAKFGRLDVLVNNAGMANPNTETVAEVSTDMVQKIYTLNFMSPLVLTREALPHIRKVKGNIVFNSSIMAKHPLPNAGVYCASKAAITSLAKVIAMEEAANEVRVNVISPGVVKSEMTMFYLAGKTEEEVDKMFKKMQMLPHAGLPEHIGDAVVYLTNDKTGHFVTGTDLVVDGGALLNPFQILNAFEIQ